MVSAEWRALPGYEGIYEISDHGEVKSRDRINARGWRIKGRTLRPYVTPDGYQRVNLYSAIGAKHNTSVHQLVMLAFVGPCPPGQEVLHRDGNGENNYRSNLSYGTRSENVRDSVRHGTHTCAAKTHCKRGHEFTEANTFRKSSGSRECRACRAVRAEMRRAAA